MILNLKQPNDQNPDECYERFVGMNKQWFVSPKYMRDTLRKPWEDTRDNKGDPFVAPLDKTTNTIYEGCKVIGWYVDPYTQREVIKFSQMELGDLSFYVDQINQLQIGC